MTNISELDPERQKQARQYSRIKRRVWLINTLLGLVYTLPWLFLGLAENLRQALENLTTNPWLLVPVFAVVFGGIYYGVSLPLSYYSGFILPHRFGQSTQVFKDWVLDQVKGLAVGAPIGLILLELLYMALRAAGDAWWLLAAAGWLVVNVLLVNLAPILIMPIFNKYVPLGQEHAELADHLVRLADRANTRVQGVFKFDMSRRTKAANAALTGIGNTRRIILGDTLINEFTPDEIETVLAHELGHHVNKDIPLLIGFDCLITSLGLYLASLAMSWVVGAFSYRSVSDVAALPALLLVLGVYSLLLMPLENGFSRWRERLADRYALQSTGKNRAFASAFVRLANQNLAEVDPEAWVVFLFYNHPPLKERIRDAEGFPGVSS